MSICYREPLSNVERIAQNIFYPRLVEQVGRVLAPTGDPEQDSRLTPEQLDFLVEQWGHLRTYSARVQRGEYR